MCGLLFMCGIQVYHTYSIHEGMILHTSMHNCVNPSLSNTQFQCVIWIVSMVVWILITASVFAIKISLERYAMVSAWSVSNSWCISTLLSVYGFYISPQCSDT